MSRAFAVELNRYDLPDHSYRGRDGFVHVPKDLADIITGVLGLDNRRVVRHHSAAVRSDSAAANTPVKAVQLTPPQVAKLYDFPAGGATGQTVGILEFGGGYVTDPVTKRASDVDSFCTNLGLRTPSVTSVPVLGVNNSPMGSKTNFWVDDKAKNPISDTDIEVALDLEIVAAVLASAKIAVYFAPNNSDGFYNAVQTAVQDTVNRPDVLSISWGGSELNNWSSMDIDHISSAFEDAFNVGVSVFVSSGDDGSDCGVGDGSAHVEYPGSDQWVVCCGGTMITNVAGARFNEGTWNDSGGGATGGGISDHFDPQTWQAKAGVPSSVNPGHRKGRGVPDVAGNASPNSGYDLWLYGTQFSKLVVTSGKFIGESGFIEGGTSAVAPLYAALAALINAARGTRCPFLNPVLYRLNGTSVLRDINDGLNNQWSGESKPAPSYKSGPGWDACTGLGSINGNALLAALRFDSPVNKTVASWSANRLDIFGLGTDHAMYHKFWDGSHWGPTPTTWEPLGGVFTSPPAVVAWGPNRLDIFGLGTDNQMYHKFWDGSHWGPTPTTWEPLGGVFTSPPAVAAWSANRLDIFGLGTDFQMYHKFWDGSHWGPTPTTWEPLGGVFTSPPAVVAWGPNRLDIFGLGTDNQMYHKFWDGSHWGPTPTTWEPLGGVFTSPPAVAAWSANRLDIFGLGTDFQMYHKFWDGSHWGPTPTTWEPLGGVFTSPPAVVAWGPNRLDIFGLGTDNQMYHKFWDGSHWGPTPTTWEPLGGVFTSPPAVVAWGPNRLDIFGLGTDNQMYHKFWDGSHWGPTPTTWEPLGGVFSEP